MLNSTAHIKPGAFVPLGARCARFGCLLDVEILRVSAKEMLIHSGMAFGAGWPVQRNKSDVGLSGVMNETAVHNIPST
jgi:hypothetical protein